MTAAVFTITKELCEARLDWKACERFQVQHGPAWAMAAENAQAIFKAQMARLADVSREAAVARETFAMEARR